AKPALGQHSLSRRQFIQWTAAGFSLSAMLAACAPPGVQPQTGSQPAAVSNAGPTKQIWMGHQEVAGLSPDDAGPAIQWVLIINIHNPLVYYDYDFNLVQALAESQEVSADGLKYTFHLRKGVKFHDGADFTSKDVKYT